MLYVWVEQGNMRQSDTEADINCELRQSVKKFSVKVRRQEKMKKVMKGSEDVSQGRACLAKQNCVSDSTLRKPGSNT